MAEIGKKPSDPPTLIREATHLDAALRALVRVHRARDRQRALRYDLVLSHYHALLALTRMGPLTVTALGEHLHLEKSTASRVAKGLLGQGLVRKRSPSSDDRKVILQVTELGMRLSRRIQNDLSEEYLELLSNLEPGSRDDLPGVLTELARRLETSGISTAGPE